MDRSPQGHARLPCFLTGLAGLARGRLVFTRTRRSASWPRRAGCGYPRADLGLSSNLLKEIA